MKFKFKKFPITEFLNRLHFIEAAIDVVFFLFLFPIRKINKFFSSSGGNVLIISIHKIGDTIFTIPAIDEIVKKYKQRCIIICNASSIPIYNLVFKDINYLPIEKGDFHFQERIAKHKLKKKIKSINPSIIFDLNGWIISASLIYNIRAKEIIGMNSRRFKALYDKFVEPRKSPKLQDIYLDAISTELKTDDVKIGINSPLSIKPEGNIIIHPHAGWSEKEWNFRNFAYLAQRLNEDYHCSLIIPTDSVSIDVLKELRYSGIEIIESNSSQKMIEAIRKSSLFIGNDSGPVNIANFLGKPTFTIYGSTNPAYTASSAEYQKYVQLKLNCSAEENEKYCIIGPDTYYCPGTQCMNLLTVDYVYEAIIAEAKKYCA